MRTNLAEFTRYQFRHINPEKNSLSEDFIEAFKQVFPNVNGKLDQNFSEGGLHVSVEVMPEIIAMWRFRILKKPFPAEKALLPQFSFNSLEKHNQLCSKLKDVSNQMIGNNLIHVSLLVDPIINERENIVIKAHGRRWAVYLYLKYPELDSGVDLEDDMFKKIQNFVGKFEGDSSFSEIVEIDLIEEEKFLSEVEMSLG